MGVSPATSEPGMIEVYCKQFFGYGRWDAPIWCVGLEEAGAGAQEELQARLLAWDQRGRRELEDAPAFYPACGQHQWHGPRAKLQQTWRQLMRMVLLARGERVDNDALLEYQKHAFGAFSGDVCLTELSPLPAPNHREWPYAAHQALPARMQSREEFTQTLVAGRVATLREKIALYRPRAVVFYFWKPRKFAEEIAGGEFCPRISEQLLGLGGNGTTYFVTGHPAGPYPDSWAGISMNTTATCLPLSASRQFGYEPARFRSPPPFRLCTNQHDSGLQRKDVDALKAVTCLTRTPPSTRMVWATECYEDYASYTRSFTKTNDFPTGSITRWTS